MFWICLNRNFFAHIPLTFFLFNMGRIRFLGAAIEHPSATMEMNVDPLFSKNINFSKIYNSCITFLYSSAKYAVLSTRNQSVPENLFSRYSFRIFTNDNKRHVRQDRATKSHYYSNYSIEELLLLLHLCEQL